jgi:hypothetical protein
MPTDLERLTITIEANTRSYERAMLRLQAQTEKAIRGSTRSINTLDKSLKAVSATARTFAGVFGLSFGISELPKLVKAVADLGDQADKIGITAEQLQELNFQADQTGVSAETLADGLTKFSKGLSEARTGSGELYKLLKANGLALDDIAKMDVNEALRVFVDLLGNATDETDKLKIATIGFGRGGADLALTFAGGKQAMLEFQLQARASSQVISNELVKSAQDIDDEFSKLTGTITTMVKAGLLEFLETTKKEIAGIKGVLDDLRVSAEEGARAAGRRTGELIARGTPKSSDVANQRISQAFDVAGEEEAARKLRRTVVPPSGVARAAGRNAAADAAKREHDQVAELIAELQRELSLVGATAEQQRISNELHTAGAAATEKEKQQITELVSAIEAQERAREELIDTLDTIRDAAASSMDAFVQSIANSEGPLNAMKAALKDILQTIIQIAQRQLITNLLGAAGTASSGGLKIPGLSVGKAAATQAVAVHITAAPSPLLDIKIQQSGRAAESRAIARGPAVAHNNNQRFAVP